MAESTRCNASALWLPSHAYFLRREGKDVNAKRIYRLDREEKLSLRTKTPKRRVSCRTRVDRPEATHMNDCWAVSNRSGFHASIKFTVEVFDGRQIRLLTIADYFTRESPAVEVGQRMRGRDVVTVLASLARDRKLPQSIRVAFELFIVCSGNENGIA